jgi:class 3 adenylate cyclase
VEIGHRDPERRQLTTLFCDMVDSTALASRLDPEDLREIMQAYLDDCTAIITAFGGHVASYMGDGVLGFFGYPQALEDAAERAMHAGFDLLAMARGRGARTGLGLQARVGVATGLVVVGDRAHPDFAYGGALPLAARLQGLAEPDTMIIAEGTRRLIGNLFELRDLGLQPVKGFGSVRAWRALGPARIESRFTATRVASERTIIGRTQELDLLLDRWRAACAGHAQAVLIAGEAGIGKSCLVAALARRIEAVRHTTLRLNGSPLHTDTPLHPLLAMPEQAPGGEDLATIISEFARFAGPVRDNALALSANAARRRVLNGLLQKLTDLAHKTPLLVLVEDAHWIDPTTQDLIGRWILRGAGTRSLTLVTSRPEFKPPWDEPRHVLKIALGGMALHEARALTARVTGGTELLDEVVAAILAKTDGVPLFIEELTKSLLESGQLREENGRLVPASSLPALALPSTLQDSLLARLDRLDRVKEVAQIAAGIGRDFSRRLLALVCPLAPDALNAALEQLVAAGIVRQTSRSPGSAYQFKHALLAEAAYDALLRSRKRELHGRIACALQEQFPDLLESQPEQLAHHLTEAGLSARAAAWWEKAARLALSRGAHLEVQRHLSRALALLDTLPQDRARDEWEMALRMALRRSLLFVRGYGTREADPNYDRLQYLGEALGRTETLLGVLNGRCILSTVRCDFPALVQHAKRLIDLATAHNDRCGIAVGHFHLAVANLYTARLEQVATNAAAVRTACSPELRAACIQRYNFCPDLTVCGVEALVFQFLGSPVLARAMGLAAAGESRAFSDPATHLIVLHRVVLSRILDGDLLVAEALAGELADQAERIGVRSWSEVAPLFLRWVDAKRRGLEQPLVKADPRRFDEPERYWAYYLLLDAELLLAAGRHTEAWTRLDFSESLLARTGERLFEPELLRLRVLAHRAAGARPEELDQRFEQTLAAARQSGLKLWHLRTATDCAEYWRDSGRGRAALRLLQPLFASYDEGFDMPDLRRAREVLDTLS